MNPENSHIKIYSQVINSDAYEACKEVSTILNMLKVTYGINTDQYFDIKVILSELIQNAIQHGNDCISGKKICVDVWMKENGRLLGITVKDQGYGFDPLREMNIAVGRMSESDPDPMNMDECGRGLYIVQKLSDWMEFNALGNAITVMKRL